MTQGFLPAELPLLDEAEVVVVGAGPAGASCASLLAEAGHDVLVVDQSDFPREKPCGDGLTRASVAFLERMGLDDLLAEGQQVHGVRVIVDHRHVEPKAYDSPARCITRRDLDHRLLQGAVARGARFLRSRVDGALTIDGTVEGVTLGLSGGEAAIHARCVIAADGATSRLRRECGFRRPPDEARAYAVRQYCMTELGLAPQFDVFVPIEVDGQGLIAYGWVFPVAERLANVGVGYFRGGGLADPPSLRRTLAAFLEELQTTEVQRYGSIEPVSPPFGSPVGVNFTPERCQYQRILFAGDAALTTDPLSGEGIAYALQGGALVADVAHRALSNGCGASWHEDLDLGRRLGRRFLRLGQDIAVLNRIGARHLARRVPSPADTRTASEPFIDSMTRLVASPDRDPTLTTTPVAVFAAEYGIAHDGEIERMNEETLDDLRTEFPLATEAIHRELRGNSGPAAAITLIAAARASGREPDRVVIAAAIAVELLSLFPAFAAQVVDRASRKRAKLNNALAVLVADFVVSRALRRSAVVGREASRALAETACAMCEGEMIDANDRGNTGRRLERYLAAAELKQGRLHALAAGLGGELGGCSAADVASLRRYGLELGIAFRISDDICALVAKDPSTGRPAGSALQEGNYTLPVLYGLSGNGNGNGNGHHAGWLKATDEPADVVARLCASGAVDGALAECDVRAHAAQIALRSSRLNGALRSLADFPRQRARAAVGGESVHLAPTGVG
jgi:geranylgeranyl reductase family protein